MFIRKLRPGERAAESANRICVARGSDGRISWMGSMDAGKSGASPITFTTIQEAETDAIAWAKSQGATEIQIEGPAI